MAVTAAAAAGAGPQHYCLRWNNYQSNLTSVFDQLLQSESFVDVTLAVAGRALKAHKVILSASSPYFQTLLHDNPCGHPIVVIEDVSHADMQAIVQFMYKGEINVAEQQLPSLLKVAEALKIRGLADVPEGETVTRRAAPEPQRRQASAEAGGSPEPAAAGRAPPQVGQTPERPPQGPAMPPGTTAEPRPAPAPSQAPAHSRASDDTEIRPAIIEMIKEEERAMMMENNSSSWNSPPEPTFQHQLQQAWQKSWNQQQSLLQNLRFRERGPLKSWRPETMAAAIMSVLREGHSLSQAARTYDIPYPTFVLYANRVHNLLGPSQEGPGGIPNELRPKGRGRPQRILLGVWPEETVNNVIRAVVFRDTSGLKEQMESKAAAVAAAAAAAGHGIQDMPASLTKLMQQHQQQQQQSPHTPTGPPQPHMNGRPPFRMQAAPPMPPRVGGPPMAGGGGGGRGGAPSGLPHPAAAGARHRPPNLLGFPDMHMMMGMFPPGMLSATGGVPQMNLPPLLDQKPPVGVGTSAGPSPPTRPVPGLSSIAGGAARSDSCDTDPAGENSNTSGGGGGPEPCLLEPLQEMTEGDEPLQVRRDLDSPAAEGADSPAQTHRSTPDSAPPAKRIKDMHGYPGMPPFRMQAAPPMPPRVGGPPMAGGGGGGRGGAPSGLPHPAAAGARHRPPSLLGFPDMHMMMGMFPPGMLSATGAVPTINLPPLVDQKPTVTKTEAPSPSLPEVTISSVPIRSSPNDTTPTPPFLNGPQSCATSNGPPSAPGGTPAESNGGLGRSDSCDTDPAGENSNTSGGGGGGPEPCLLEPLQEMTEGDEPLQVRRDLDSPGAEGADGLGGTFGTAEEIGAAFTKQMQGVTMYPVPSSGDQSADQRTGPGTGTDGYPADQQTPAERPAGAQDVHGSLAAPAAALRAMP
ncbi:protein bric-a-brac 2-like isoform X2 [Amphibalanus amphitrite]|uniref:protein bric-a-brac 2-like isoform X2 n=1 Tax=Amphibalanus amphitrite TaxID=1232801 RepID=UPI001C91316E|nr:protein bric-a-brac 2-like isoform X2 [Amphibalanus amphitrite]